MSSVKVSILAGLLHTFHYAVRNLISVLREQEFREDIVQQIVQLSLPMDDLFARRKAYLSAFSQTLAFGRCLAQQEKALDESS